MEIIEENKPVRRDSESFGHGKMHYFIDVNQACNNTLYMLISSSEKYDTDKFRRQTVMIWEEDLGMFVEGLSMILSRMVYGEGPKPFQRPEVLKLKDPAGILALPESDRPREKLHALSAAALSNAELMAILLCTGSQELSVLDLCKKIMRSVKDDPSRLLTRTAEDFCSFRGVGVAKAATLMAALELGRRAFLSPQH
jgi:DNA repair protein RadC